MCTGAEEVEAPSAEEEDAVAARVAAATTAAMDGGGGGGGRGWAGGGMAGAVTTAPGAGAVAAAPAGTGGITSAEEEEDWAGAAVATGGNFSPPCTCCKTGKKLAFWRLSLIFNSYIYDTAADAKNTTQFFYRNFFIFKRFFKIFPTIFFTGIFGLAIVSCKKVETTSVSATHSVQQTLQYTVYFRQ